MADAKRPRPGSEEPDDEESLALRTALEETQNELDKVGGRALRTVRRGRRLSRFAFRETRPGLRAMRS